MLVFGVAYMAGWVVASGKCYLKDLRALELSMTRRGPSDLVVGLKPDCFAADGSDPSAFARMEATELRLRTRASELITVQWGAAVGAWQQLRAPVAEAITRAMLAQMYPLEYTLRRLGVSWNQVRNPIRNPPRTLHGTRNVGFDFLGFACFWGVGDWG